MSEIRVGFDVDDVLYETARQSVGYFNEVFGLNLTLEDMYRRPTVESNGSDDLNVLLQRVNRFIIERGLELPVMEDAVKITQALADKGMQLYAITGRSPETEDVTRQALTRDFGDIFKNVMFTSHLDEERRTSKGDICRELDLTAFIEDLPAHVRDILGKSGTTTALLFGDYPWNSLTEDSDIIRCPTWADVEREVDQVASR